MHVMRIPVFLPIGIVVVLFVAGWFAPARAAMQEATPAGCPTTTPEENKELVRRWFDALSSGNPEDLAAVAAPDIIYHDPAPEEEAQTGGSEEWAGERQQDYPDLQVTVEQMVAEGDMVASYQRSMGTQQGDVEEEQGVPATGRQTEWVSMGLFRIECGKIAEIWSVADDLGRLQRLGVITAEELQSAAPVATPSG
jgi:steroid delta-isomerase-like uncharacterized protein